MGSSWHLLRNYPSVFSQRGSVSCPLSAQTVGMILPAPFTVICPHCLFHFLSFSLTKFKCVTHSTALNRWSHQILMNNHLQCLSIWLGFMTEQEMNCMCVHDFWEGCPSRTLVYLKAGRLWKDPCGPVKYTFPTVTEGIVRLVQPSQDCSTNVRRKVALCRVLHFWTLKFWFGKVIRFIVVWESWAMSNWDHVQVCT